MDNINLINKILLILVFNMSIITLIDIAPVDAQYTGRNMTLGEAMDFAQKRIQYMNAQFCDVTNPSLHLNECLLIYVGIDLTLFYFFLAISIFSILVIGVYYIRLKNIKN